jgi:hypothetical protein
MGPAVINTAPLTQLDLPLSTIGWRSPLYSINLEQVFTKVQDPLTGIKNINLTSYLEFSKPRSLKHEDSLTYEQPNRNQIAFISKNSIRFCSNDIPRDISSFKTPPSLMDLGPFFTPSLL